MRNVTTAEDLSISATACWPAGGRPYQLRWAREAIHKYADTFQNALLVAARCVLLLLKLLI